MTSNQIAYFKALEDVRTHREQEYNQRVANENARRAADRNADIAQQNADTNVVSAFISAYAQEAAKRTSEANWLNALTNVQNAETRRQELFETSRSNQFYEGETYRHNLASEDLGYNQLFETVRQHQAQEALGYSQLFETQRANMAQEGLKNQGLLLDSIAEEHNYNIRKKQAQTDLFEAEEAKRHNIAMENVQFLQAWGNIGNSVTNVFGTLAKFIH